MALQVDAKSFDAEVIKSDIPVLVDFWAEWCGPCKMVAPVVEKIANDYAGRVKVAKVDVDANQTLAVQFGIMSIPTLMIFKDGKPADQIIGYTPYDNIAQRLNRLL